MDIPIEKPIENVEEESFITQLIESGTILPAPSPENRRAHANHIRCERVVDEGLKSRMFIFPLDSIFSLKTIFHIYLFIYLF